MADDNVTQAARAQQTQDAEVIDAEVVSGDINDLMDIDLAPATPAPSAEVEVAKPKHSTAVGIVPADERVGELVQAVTSGQLDLKSHFGQIRENGDAVASPFLKGEKKDSGSVVVDLLVDLQKEMRSLDGNSLTRKRSKILQLIGRGQQSLGNFLEQFENADAAIESVKERLGTHYRELEEDEVVLVQSFEATRDSAMELAAVIVAAYELRETEEGRQMLYESLGMVDVGDDATLQQLTQSGLEQELDRWLTDMEGTLQVQQMHMINMVTQIQSGRQVRGNIERTVNEGMAMWKSVMLSNVIALRQGKAAEADKMVGEMTNDMMVRGSEAIRENAVAIASKAEQPLYDPKALEKVAGNIAGMVEDVKAIQAEGVTKREEARELYAQTGRKVEALVSANSGRELGSGEAPAHAKALAAGKRSPMDHATREPDAERSR